MQAPTPANADKDTSEAVPQRGGSFRLNGANKYANVAINATIVQPKGIISLNKSPKLKCLVTCFFKHSSIVIFVVVVVVINMRIYLFFNAITIRTLILYVYYIFLFSRSFTLLSFYTRVMSLCHCLFVCFVRFIKLKLN